MRLVEFNKLTTEATANSIDSGYISSFYDMMETLWENGEPVNVGEVSSDADTTLEDDEWALSENDVGLSTVKTYTPVQLAKMHHVGVNDILDQLHKGIAVEKEHTTSASAAREIALDHLKELPDYYDRLADMEASGGVSEAYGDYECDDDEPDYKSVAEKMIRQIKSLPEVTRDGVTVELHPHKNYYTDQYMPALVLSDLFLDQTGTGLGTRIMKKILDIATTNDFSIFTDAAGPDSYRFYTRLGFTKDRKAGHQLVWHPPLPDWMNENDETERRAIMRKAPASAGVYTMYRACPSGVDEFRPMDYVTLSRKFALIHSEHMEATEGEPYHVIRKMIRNDDRRPVLFEAPNTGEYFYDGPVIKGKEIRKPDNLFDSVGFSEAFNSPQPFTHISGDSNKKEEKYSFTVGGEKFRVGFFPRGGGYWEVVYSSGDHLNFEPTGKHSTKEALSVYSTVLAIISNFLEKKSGDMAALILIGEKSNRLASVYDGIVRNLAKKYGFDYERFGNDYEKTYVVDVSSLNRDVLEAFDSPVDYEQLPTGSLRIPDDHIRGFRFFKDDNEYIVYFTQYPNNRWNVVFAKQATDGVITYQPSRNKSTSDVFVVYATIVKIIADFIKANGAEIITFDGDKESNLSNVYDRVVKGLSKKYGYTYDVTEVGSKHVYYLFVKQTSGHKDATNEAKKPWLRITPEMLRQAKGNKNQLVVEMPADQFLLMTTSSEQGREQIKQLAKPIQSYNRWAKMGDDKDFAARVNKGKIAGDDGYIYGSIHMPWLTIQISDNSSIGTVVGHEGRHRVAASLKTGNKTVTVAIGMRPNKEQAGLDFGYIYKMNSEHLPDTIIGQYDGNRYSTTDWRVVDNNLQRRRHVTELNQNGVSVAGIIKSLRAAKINSFSADADFEYALYNLGWHQLGSGSFSQVYDSPDYPYVIKVSSKKDSGYEQFVGITKQYRNKSFPKIAGPFDVGGYNVYVMEKLIPLGEAVSSKDIYVLNQLAKWWENGHTGHSVVTPEIQKLGKDLADKYGKSFIQAMLILRKEKLQGTAFDMVASQKGTRLNIMRRPSTGELVIIDPFISTSSFW